MKAWLARLGCWALGHLVEVDPRTGQLIKPMVCLCCGRREWKGNERLYGWSTYEV